MSCDALLDTNDAVAANETRLSLSKGNEAKTPYIFLEAVARAFAALAGFSRGTCWIPSTSESLFKGIVIVGSGMGSCGTRHHFTAADALANAHDAVLAD